MNIFLVIKTATAPKLQEIQGIFSTKEKAIEACREWGDIYQEYKLDEELPRETVHLETFHPMDATVTRDGGATWEAAK